MWLLMSAMVLSLYPTPSTSSNVHWSKVQWGKCADKATSRWEFQKQATGMRVVEKSTGRCLAIKAGELPVPPGGANAYGAMVAEPCGDGGPEKGASQLWQFRDQKATPMLITNDVKKVTGPLALHGVDEAPFLGLELVGALREWPRVRVRAKVRVRARVGVRVGVRVGLRLELGFGIG